MRLSAALSSLLPWPLVTIDSLRPVCLQAFRPIPTDNFNADVSMTEHVDLVWEDACCAATQHWGLKWGISSHAVDTKLIYDSFVWRHLFGKANDGPCSVLELLPGSSLTIPLALISAGIDCKLIRLDRNVGSIRDPQTSAGIDITHMVADLHESEISWHGYSWVVGNHILDDLILAGWDRSSYVRSFGDPMKTRELCLDFLRSEKRFALIERSASRLCNLARTLDPGATLLLREYPASFALFHCLTEQIVIHGEIFSAVKSGLETLPGRLSVEDLTSISVPRISKLPGTVIRYQAIC